MVLEIENKKINNDIRLENQISLERGAVDENSLDIVPILLTEEFLLAYYIYDFLLDGYKVISTQDITKIGRGDIEKYHSSILKNEDTLHKSNSIEFGKIKNWETLFHFLKNEEVIVDISLKEPENNDFFVGKIVEANAEFLEILEISPLGKWEEKGETVWYSHIALVSFGNNYSEMLLKYSETIDK